MFWSARHGVEILLSKRRASIESRETIDMVIVSLKNCDFTNVQFCM